MWWNSRCWQQCSSDEERERESVWVFRQLWGERDSGWGVSRGTARPGAEEADRLLPQRSEYHPRG